MKNFPNLLTTLNLRLVACDPEILQTALAGDDQLAQALGVEIAREWTTFGPEALRYAQIKLAESEHERGWWTYLPIHKIDNKLIGSGGYKGRPTEDGVVEIGYEIAPDYRCKGFATEMATGLIQQAFNSNLVRKIIAHTLPQDNSSTHVLKKCGFTITQEITDPEDGIIWQWKLTKSRFTEMS